MSGFPRQFTKILLRCMVVAMGAPLLLLSAPAAARTAAGRSCADLAALSLPHTRIILARRYDKDEPVDEDVRLPTDGRRIRAPAALCRVAGVIRRKPGSTIRFEVWLPEQWNGRYMQSGNGGFAGSIPRKAIATLAGMGSAASATDDGTGGTTVAPAETLRRNPATVEDWAYLAAHLTALRSKAILKAYYRRASDHAYFIGCSKGGNEALSEAQRYPADFDGIIAGAPGISQTETLGYLIAVQQQLSERTHPERLLLNRKLPALAEVHRQCPAAYLPGDGFLNNPLACRFDPAPLLCKGDETDRCLTAGQIGGLRTVLAGQPKRDRNSLPYGAIPDFSTGWKDMFALERPDYPVSAAGRLGVEYYANLLDRTITPATFDPVRDPQDMNARFGAVTAADNADLSAFRARGGRLILWHGWGDTIVMAKSLISYVERVRHALGADAAAEMLRLYPVSGMAHCAGGPGPTDFGQGLGYAGYSTPLERSAQGSILPALIDWVESGRAPNAILATGKRDGKTYERPLCSYPLTARRTGNEGAPSAASYACGTGS